MGSVPALVAPPSDSRSKTVDLLGDLVLHGLHLLAGEVDDLFLRGLRDVRDLLLELLRGRHCAAASPNP